MFYLDEKRTGHINALRGLVKGVAASGAAGHVIALRGVVKGGVMSGVLHRIDDPGSPVMGYG